MNDADIKISQWACFLCFPEVTEIGLIAPGYSLIFNKGKYQILGGQGHRDDEIYTFPVKPDSGLVGEDRSVREETWVKLQLHIEAEFRLEPRNGYFLVSSCMPEYKNNMSFTTWMMYKCERLIRDFEQKTNQVLPIGEDQYGDGKRPETQGG